MLRFLVLIIGLMVLALLGLLFIFGGLAAFGTYLGVRRLRARWDQKVARGKLKRRQAENPEDPLEKAWMVAGEQADWAVSRVATARTSCQRLIEVADADPLATDAVDWANVVRRRVPDLVLACMEENREATHVERRRNLDDLVESLEKIGAEAERRRDRYRDGRVSAFNVQRTYVDQRTKSDPLG